MEYIKLVFETETKKHKSKMIAMVHDGRADIRFGSSQQAEVAYNKMKADGKRVLLTRGNMLIQIFKDLKKEQIAKLFKLDAVQGDKDAKTETNIGFIKTKLISEELIKR